MFFNYGPFSPDSIDALIATIKGSPDKPVLTESTVSNALNSSIFATSRTLCLEFVRLIQRYDIRFTLLGLFRSRGARFSSLIDKMYVSPKEDEDIFRHLTYIAEQSAKMSDPVALANKNLSGASSDRIIEVYPPLMQDVFMRLDWCIKAMVSSHPTGEMRLGCVELKHHRFVSVKDKSSVQQLLSNSGLGTDDDSKKLKKAINNQRHFLDASMRQAILLARCPYTILSNGCITILVQFTKETKFESLDDFSSSRHNDGSKPPPQKKRKKASGKPAEAGHDVNLSANGPENDDTPEEIVRLANVRAEVVQRSKASGSLLSLFSWVNLMGIWSDPFEINTDATGSLKHRSALPERFLSESFNFLVEHSPNSAIWLDLYGAQRRLFVDLICYPFDDGALKQIQKGIKATFDDFSKEMEEYRKTLPKSKSASARDSKKIIDSIFAEQDFVKSNLLGQENGPYLTEVWKHIDHHKTSRNQQTMPRPASSPAGRPRHEENSTRPSTREGVYWFQNTLLKLTPRVEVHRWNYEVKSILKGSPITRDDDAENSRANMSLVLECMVDDRVENSTSVVVKLFDAVRLRASSSSNMEFKSDMWELPEMGDSSDQEDDDTDATEKYLQAQGKGHQQNTGEDIKDFQTFTELFLTSVDLFMRESVALHTLKDISNVPNLIRRGYVVASQPEELIRVPERPDYFRAEGLFLEMEKVQNVIGTSVLILLAQYGYTDHIMKKALEILNAIHRAGITHGDLHENNVLFSSQRLFGKSEEDMEKEMKELGGVIVEGLFDIHLIDFGASVSINKLKSDDADSTSRGNTADDEDNRPSSSSDPASLQTRSMKQFDRLVFKDVDRILDTMETVLHETFSPSELEEYQEYYEGLRGHRR